MSNNGLSFSRETLQATLDFLTVDSAMRMISLAGSKSEFLALVNGLSRNFGASISPNTAAVIDEASKRFHNAARHSQVSYRHD